MSSSSSAATVSLNDAVYVVRDGGAGGGSSKLEGVVLFKGPVKFASASSGDDWVGVRLTGTSVGLGKNDGSVDDVRYFDAPPNSGIFVREHAVEKRQLNKLEELKLKRELKTTTSGSGSGGTTGSGGGAAIAAGSAGKSRTSGIGTPPTKLPSTSSSTASSSSIAAASETTAPYSGKKTMSKLEELRQRRAALNARKQEVAAAAASGGGSASVPGSPDADAAAAATTTETAGVQQVDASPVASTRTGTPGKGTIRMTSGKSIQKPSSSGLRTSSTSTPSKVAPPAPASSSTSSPSSPTTKSSATALLLQQELEKVRTELESTREECDKVRSQYDEIQAQLKRSQEETGQAREQVKRLEKEKADNASATAAKEELPPTTQARDDNEELVSELRSELDAAKGQIQILEEKLERQSNQFQDDLAKAQSQVHALQHQVEDTNVRGETTMQHYKEKAKLQGEISALNRKLTQLESEKVDLETTIEDLTLDKEQLEQEKEQLEDALEESRLDADTATVQVEELKMELEDAQQQIAQAAEETAAAAAAGSYGGGIVASAASTASAEGSAGDGSAAAVEQQQHDKDVAQALSVQNSRLREALLRLREQAALEKLELGRQLREAEKDASIAQEMKQQVDSMKDAKAKMEDEINDLKDMVEQGAAFESMVEDLSDRIMAMEDDNIALRATIRDLEEAAELTQEMEEVQTDELKALTQDLEGRDTIIRNLEEAIKMQRRREEDFLRTVANYRTTVATLKQEKQALLEMQQGGEGEKSDLIAATQSALAKAAQLVSDAAAVRKREARAVVDKINEQTYHHLSFRLESLLPQAVVAPEVSAIKGELMAAKVVSTASRTLEGISASFAKTIKPALEADSPGVTPDSSALPLELSDEVRQKINTMIYQAEFAHVVAGLSSDILRLLFAGQWSDLLSHESSVELGSILGHSTASLDSSLAGVLRTLKEEGALTPEQSNIGAIKQTIVATMQALKSEIEHEDRTLLATSWHPPGWELMKNATIAKFACQGTAAAVSAVLHQSDDFVPPPELATFYNRLEQVSTQSKTVCLRLSNLDINNETLVNELSNLTSQWTDQSTSMLKAVNEALLAGTVPAASEVNKILPLLAKLSSTLRSANLSPNETESYHALSPEADDPWTGVATLSRSIRALEGDEEDVNFVFRARSLENRLEQAVEKEPKLEAATVKLANLEKSLASKSKEVSLQTARLSELEKLLAKSSASPIGGGRAKTVDFRSSEEFHAMQEENRVLTEALEVTQRQVDEYENEIRVLKDFKSPGKGARTRTPARRAITSVTDASPYSRGGTEEPATNSFALEATLFRPALQKAIREAARWKAEAMTKAMLDLPPLPSTSALGAVSEDLMELTAARASCLVAKASVTVVDVTRRDKTPRMQLRESNARVVAATERLQAVVRQCEARTIRL